MSTLINLLLFNPKTYFFFMHQRKFAESTQIVSRKIDAPRPGVALLVRQLFCLQVAT